MTDRTLEARWFGMIQPIGGGDLLVGTKAANYLHDCEDDRGDLEKRITIYY